MISYSYIKIERSLVAKQDVKTIAREMKPYISEYDKVLNNMRFYDSISDKELVNGFKETEQLINTLKQQIF